MWPEDPLAAIYTDESGIISFGIVVEATAQARTPYGHLYERPHLPGSLEQDAADGGLQNGCHAVGLAERECAQAWNALRWLLVTYAGWQVSHLCH
jgi:hypothetical protein